MKGLVSTWTFRLGDCASHDREGRVRYFLSSNDSEVRSPPNQQNAKALDLSGLVYEVRLTQSLR